jgi:Dolichyl-phosphate-mannose-protein mannosyltransferase
LLRITKYEGILVLLFLATLPLVNPWVRGDGVGYYAFARAMLIEHRLDFTKDWLFANGSFRMGRVDASGRLTPEQFTTTGHVDNHSSVGPAILWAPFLIVAHAGVIIFDRFGGHTAADGFSEPYRVAMALGTALYGFLAVLISFYLARRYVPERWAFLASLGIWFGSSLPVYMYFNPSWAHAPSAFAVALFVWYWVRTRGDRTHRQWIILGLLAGLMIDCYYMNAVLVLLPLLESVVGYQRAFIGKAEQRPQELLLKNIVFATSLLLAFLPTLITKQILYGSFLRFGYTERWFWQSPALLKVCFSSNHGLFSWTPILIPAVGGLFLLRRHDGAVGLSLLAVVTVYLYALGCYQDWHGISSFGNRFCVSLNVIFVLGLASFLAWFAQAWQERKASVLAWSGTAALVIWNLGLMFQWGMHLIPERGPVLWREVAYNQVALVPQQATRSVGRYLLHRRELMHRIDEWDTSQFKSAGPTP